MAAYQVGSSGSNLPQAIPSGYPQQQGYPVQQQGYPVQQQVPPTQQQFNPTQPNTIPVQQMVVREAQYPVNDYLVHAILVTACCFWPSGIVAIYKAWNTRILNERGDYVSARRTSREARNWSIGTLVCGIVSYVAVIIIIIVSYATTAAAVAYTVNYHDTFDENVFDTDIVNSDFDLNSHWNWG